MVHGVADGFPWRRLSYYPALRPTKAHDLVVRCLRRLGEWGLVPPGGNRLERVEKVLRQWAEPDRTVPTDGRARELIAEGIRTSIEFYYATYGVAVSPSDAMLEKVRQAVGGADLPSEESQHLARDIQFELYVHGLLAAGGAEPWFDERPDVRFRFGGETVGVAVKRLWSREGAHGQISAAAAQTLESGIRGIVATNAQEYLERVPTDEALEGRGKAFNEQVARLHGQFPYLAKKEHVLGLMVCGTAAEWAEDGSEPATLRIATYNQLFVLGTTEAEEGFANHYYGRIGEALKEWNRLNL